MKKIILFFVSFFAFTQKNIAQERPKLVVGIVVDQMRYDYLERFSDRYTKGGFKRLLKDGYSLENMHYNYIPTYTAVGHTSIYTGTTPFNHGVIANDWYDKYQKKMIYCVDDNKEKTIGNNSKGGMKSPRRMLTTTIGDQLHLAQNQKGKVIGVALKDRSAILPVGHTANAAYWFNGGNNGQWISSSFYMKKLPKWVEDFNKLGKPDQYLSKPWNTLYNIETYKISREDDNTFEGVFKGEEKPVFPHDIPNLRMKNKNYSIIKKIPAGNSLTADFAKACILNENLGKSEYTDFLSISFSATDYVGHMYGITSKEIEDTYLRLDKDLESLLDFLDEHVGKNNYTLVLTADHAAVPVPSYLQSLKIPADYIKVKKFTKYVNDITEKYFKSRELVENISNFQVFLNHDKIESLGFEVNDVAQKIADKVINYKTIHKAVTARTLQTTSFNRGILKTLQNGYSQKRSGDIMLIPSPATIPFYKAKTGTSHGSGYTYDTHVPVLFYGQGFKKGSSKKTYKITDLAPTICNLLKIEAPNGNTGEIIDEVLK